ncbi:hypothetical protein LVQ78_13975 [Buttiauxella sp. A2-C2_NF]|uniref:hypothetical protein n=1 Tax=Buttiauxella ferragutiae TaxID=82989 RepID=UPI001E419481|nr:hypothetical protein [Buttiauxella ferragutiae]MCE0827138.1 hypothetical protein [Buttiauxella ferragutiae]
MEDQVQILLAALAVMAEITAEAEMGTIAVIITALATALVMVMARAMVTVVVIVPN